MRKQHLTKQPREAYLDLVNFANGRLRHRLKVFLLFLDCFEMLHNVEQ